MRAIARYVIRYIRRYREFILYCIIGGSGVIVDFGLFYILNHIFSSYQVSNFVSFSFANLNNFLLNSRFNFKVRDNAIMRSLCFYGIGLFSWFVGAALLYALFELMGVNLYISKLMTLIIVTGVQFACNKYITFRKIRHENNSSNTNI